MKNIWSENVPPGKTVAITEVFDTTPERLFKAWTNEQDFAAWFGPEGFEALFCELDVRVGGNWRTGISGCFGDMLHPIPWQTDHLFCWQRNPAHALIA